MKILIVAATEGEISLLKGINQANHSLEFLITETGMVATAFSLTKHLQKYSYDLGINCGIAGSFDKTISIGETVLVEEDLFAELGAENDNEFIRLEEMSLAGKDTFRNSFPKDVMSALKIKTVKGITVNTVHGNEESINKIMKRLNPQIESMEGAAFYYVCEKEGLPAIQIRSVSNYVEKRNRNAWNIPLALENLKMTLEKMLQIL